MIPSETGLLLFADRDAVACAGVDDQLAGCIEVVIESAVEGAGMGDRDPGVLFAVVDEGGGLDLGVQILLKVLRKAG